MRRALTDKPALGVLIGAFAIAFSGILYRKADVSPTTGAFFRCLWALPPLWLLAMREDRRIGARPMRVRRAAWLARRVLRRRPDPLALLDRVRRRRARDGPRQHPGRDRGSPRAGPSSTNGLRATRCLRSRCDGRHHPHLGRARERGVRKRPEARRYLRCPDRDRVLGLSARHASRLGRGRPSGGRRSTTQPSRARSASSRSGS